MQHRSHSLCSLNKEAENRSTEDENRIKLLEEQLRKLSSTAEEWEEKYLQVRKSLDGS